MPNFEQSFNELVNSLFNYFDGIRSRFSAERTRVVSTISVVSAQDGNTFLVRAGNSEAALALQAAMQNAEAARQEYTRLLSDGSLLNEPEAAARAVDLLVEASSETRLTVRPITNPAGVTVTGQDITQLQRLVNEMLTLRDSMEEGSGPRTQHTPTDLRTMLAELLEDESMDNVQILEALRQAARAVAGRGTVPPEDTNPLGFLAYNLFMTLTPERRR